MYGNHANHNNAQQAKPEGYTNPFVFSYVHVISYIPVVVFLFENSSHHVALVGLELTM